MEYLLFQTMIGPIMPEVQKMILETVQKRKEIAKGAKEICSYFMVGRQGVVCIWEAPNIEALAPMIEQFGYLGIRTEIIPLEKAETAAARWEKALDQFMKMTKK